MINRRKLHDNLIVKKLSIFFIVLLIFLFISNNFALACTGFTASDENTVLVGGNEDNEATRRYVEIYPPSEGKYGKILFGYEGYGEQQGMNDQGLFWDGFSAPYLEVINGEGLEPIPDPEYFFNVEITENCATVGEVVDLLNAHDIRDLPIEICQVLFVDRFGDSVIFEGDDFIYKEGDFQAVANFYQSHPELGGYGFDRYATAISMLENMTDLSMKYFSEICDATHQEWPHPYPSTIYSLICDLKNNIIHYYMDHNYEDVWEINLSEEFEFGIHTIDVLSVFTNTNPNTPNRPFGPRNGATDEEYTYFSKATDPDRDQMYYKWDWGDGNFSEWLGPYNSGRICSASHIWSQSGSYNVRVMVRDVNTGKSEWSDPLSISMPVDKAPNTFPFLNWLFENINYNFPLLKLLYGLVLK